MKAVAVIFSVLLGAVSILASVRARWFLWVYDIPGADKTGHFVLMGTLALLIVLAFSDSRIRGHRLGALGCLIAVAAVVTLDEFSQSFLPRRTVDVNDLLASYAGIFAFGLAAIAIQRLRRRKSE